MSDLLNSIQAAYPDHSISFQQANVKSNYGELWIDHKPSGIKGEWLSEEEYKDQGKTTAKVAADIIKEVAEWLTRNQ